MKFYQLIIAILVMTLFSCQTNKNEVTITGRIQGEIPENIEYTLPINGFFSYAFRDSIQPDTLGNFTIKVEIEKPCFIFISIPGKTYGTLLVEAGMDYLINFNLESNEDSFKILSENQKGQDAYNSLPNPGHIQVGASEFYKDSVASDIKSKIKSLKDNEIAKFDDLLSNGDISDDFYQLVKLDREIYYAAVQGTVALIKKYEEDRENNSAFSSEMKQMWEDSFAETSPTSSELMRSPWYFSLAENFVFYNELTHESFNFNKVREIYDNGLIHTYNIEDAKKHLTSNMLEYYTAYYIYYEIIQEKYEKELISLFEDFKKDYPNSKYTRFLKPMINPIVEFHQKDNEPFNENVHFINDYENIKSLSESVSSLKGKRVYVDIWATWCRPCKIEFEHKAQLKELLASKNIEILYISIDEDKNDTQWKDMIKFYNLEGYHIRANKELNDDLIKIFDQGGSFSIPWYLIIDENGNIIKEHASRPSELKELEKELNENM